MCVETEKTIRKYTYIEGIDLLRIFCMLMVVSLHVIGNGGIRSSLEQCSIKYCIMWQWETFNYCAVNCFGMISGYLLWNRTYKLSRFFRFIFEIFVIMLIVYIGYDIVTLSTGISIHEIKQQLYMCIPIYSNLWYVKAYCGLLIIMPIANSFIKQVEINHFKIIALSFFLLLLMNRKDIFLFNEGYSVIWLFFMYIIGGLLSKYRNQLLLNRWKWGICYIFISVLASGIKIACEYVKINSGLEYTNTSVVNYTSIFIILQAICVFQMIVSVEIKSKMGKAIIQRISASMIGVYVFHMHPIIRTYIVERFSEYSTYNIGKMIVLTVVTIIIIFTVSTIVACMLTEIARRLYTIFANTLRNRDLFIHNK